jgi:predicted methyltransferase
MPIGAWIPKKISDEDWRIIDSINKNRPTPFRCVDQIPMRDEYLILQAQILADEVAGKRVIFLGDPEISLVLGVYATQMRARFPDHILVIDFDKRILKSIAKFAKDHGFDYLIDTELYNVKWKVPEKYIEWGDYFYTNPAFGFSAEGLPIIIFIDRCLSMCAPRASGCIILPYDQTRPRTPQITQNVQTYLLEMNCVIREMVWNLHLYKLDDDPNLRSSYMLIDRLNSRKTRYKKDKEIPIEDLKYFYGSSDEPVPEYIEEDGTFIYKKECLRKEDYDIIKKSGRCYRII